MNDQHPHAGHVGYDDRPTGSFDTDPLFGSLPGGHDTGYDVGHPAATYGDATYGQSAYGDGYATAYATGQPDHSGQYDASAWSTGAQQTLTHDGYAAQEHLQDHPQQAHATQQWDTSGAWQQVDDQDLTGQWATADTGAFPTTGFPSAPYGTDAAYGAEGKPVATPGDAAYEPEQTSHSLYEQQQAGMTAPEGPAEADGTAGEPVHDASSTAQFDALTHDIAADAAPDVTPEPEQDAGDGFPDPYSVNRTATVSRAE
ncbi:M23 family peptidase, partial [Streptomyces sp. MBT55]|nr:M23 family peptidase [Streptomyces sp. MBT55]